jgi:hypothetical protein
MAGTPQEQQRVLEEFYDQSIAKLEVPKVLQQAHKNMTALHKVHASAKKWQAFAESSYGGSLLSPVRRGMGRLAKIAHEHTVEPMDDAERRGIDQALRDTLARDFSDDVVVLLEDAGAQFLMRRHPKGNTRGSSNYVAGIIELESSH